MSPHLVEKSPRLKAVGATKGNSRHRNPARLNLKNPLFQMTTLICHTLRLCGYVYSFN